MYHKEVLILRQQLDKSTNLNFFKPKTEKTKYVKDKDVFLYTQPKFNSEKKKEEIFVKNRARPWNSKKKDYRRKCGNICYTVSSTIPMLIS